MKFDETKQEYPKYLIKYYQSRIDRWKSITPNGRVYGAL